MALLRDQLTGKSSTNTGYSPFTAAHRERRALYDAYWSYYRGKHRRSLRVEPGSTPEVPAGTYLRACGNTPGVPAKDHGGLCCRACAVWMVAGA